jgi:hypothetical protein
MPDLKDFENFDDFDFGDSKKEKKPKLPKLPKIKITKKQIIGVLIAIIFLYVGYIYLQYLTPKHFKLVCKTENGYDIPCPPYEIKGKNGNIIVGNDLLPGRYDLVVHSNSYHSGFSKEIEIGLDPKQEEEIKLSGIDIEHIDTNISVYPKIKGKIKIVFKNPYAKPVKYAIEIRGDSYYKKFSGNISRKEQEIVIGDVFCQSTQKICLGKKKYLTYKMNIKYGDIDTEKKVYVYILPDIKLRFEGPTTVTLYENKTLKQMYKVTLNDRMPKPIYNVSVKMVNLDPFVLNISKTKLNLYPGNTEEFNVIYKYSPGTQNKYSGTIKITKDLYEYTKDITINLKNKR